MHIPELSLQTYNDHNEERCDGFEYRSVGWLGDRVERPGETEPEIVHRLHRLKANNQLSDCWMGFHTCEICLAEKGESQFTPKRGETKDKGEFFVEHGTTRYVLPNLVIHYIAQHGYRLPEVVEQAIRERPG
jgi:hypothetical protein